MATDFSVIKDSVLLAIANASGAAELPDFVKFNPFSFYLPRLSAEALEEAKRHLAADGITGEYYHNFFLKNDPRGPNFLLSERTRGKTVSRPDLERFVNLSCTYMHEEWKAALSAANAI